MVLIIFPVAFILLFIGYWIFGSKTQNSALGKNRAQSVWWLTQVDHNNSSKPVDECMENSVRKIEALIQKNNSNITAGSTDYIHGFLDSFNSESNSTPTQGHTNINGFLDSFN